MVSQPATRLLSTAALPDDDTRVQATLELRCGCTVTQAIAIDRILQRPDGERIAVGKYRCPVGHPVT